MTLRGKRRFFLAQAAGSKRTVSGNPVTLSGAKAGYAEVRIEGNASYTHTPTPASPASLCGVGDAVQEGQYKIILEASGDTQSQQTVMVDKPLLALQKYADPAVKFACDDTQTRRIRELVLTGEETGWRYWFGGDNIFGIRVEEAYRSPVYSYAAGFATLVNCYCTHCRPVSYDGGKGSLYWYHSNPTESGGDYIACKCSTYAGNTDVLMIRNTDCADLDSFKAWLKAEYEKGTPVTFYYELAIPERTETVMPEVYVNAGTTVLLAKTLATEQPGNICVSYTADGT